jgi:hypothetical protein
LTWSPPIQRLRMRHETGVAPFGQTSQSLIQNSNNPCLHSINYPFDSNDSFW